MKLVVLDANAYWTEQLFRHCGRFAEVLLLKPRDFRAHQKSSGTIWSDSLPRQVLPNVWEQRLSMPPGWMFGFWPFAQRKIAGVMRRFASGNPITLVLTFPQYRGLIPALSPARSLYYNFDDYRDNWPGREAQIPELERELVEMADDTVCIANHRASVLREQHPAKAIRIHHIPIGCTPEFMAESAACLHPPELSALPRPIAGYVGALNWRFDFAFLAEAAEKSPDITFALGGKPPVDSDGDAAWQSGLQRARKLPNIRFLGWIDHARLGEFLNSFDVLFMSYSRCNFNTNACPAKLWDYLGTGKPIVANDANPETLLWAEVVSLVASPGEFASALRDALANSLRKNERQLQIAREHTWEVLSHRLENILNAAK